MELEKKKEELKKLLKIEEKQKRLAEINEMMNQPEFWGEREKAVIITQELTRLQGAIKNWEEADSAEKIEKLELEAVLSGEYDANNAIITISAGAGGTEAQDWAAMLLRMYSRYAERKGYKIKVLNTSEGEETGIKSATMVISGMNAYGYLKTEDGVHRLVRLSPFDADKARHTSFASVEVLPEIGERGEVKIDPKEIRIDTYRSSGHGGQGVNTTDSAVRITHIATGIVVTCQNERSQLQNREAAMEVLRAKLFKQNIENKRKFEVNLTGEHEEAAWGNQIRSYVLHPYQMVKDHRTNHETSDTVGVLNGDIDGFIEAYLKNKR